MPTTGAFVAAIRAEEELRRFGRGLHPTALDADDLGTSLTSLAEGLPLSVEVHTDISRLTPELRDGGLVHLRGGPHERREARRRRRA